MLDTWYECDVLDLPKTKVKVYVAKIIGKHPEYVFKRDFVHLTRRKKAAHWHYIADVDNYGVYELQY